MDKIRLPIKLLIFAVKDATLVVCFKDNESRCIKRDISAFLCYLFRLQTICRQNKIIKATTNTCNSFYSDPGGIQTHDLQNRNLTLYSAKLPGQSDCKIRKNIYFLLIFPLFSSVLRVEVNIHHY
jgi:hypothetical protein